MPEPSVSEPTVPEPLVLHPLTGPDLEVLAAGRPVTVAGRELVWPADDLRVLRYRREALAADPACAPYLLHVAVDARGALRARIGCHEGPLDGTVEIGYAVAAAERGHGVGTALVTVFLDWLGTQGVTRVRASVSPGNAASRAVLRRHGFVEVGERWDDEDGRELVLETVLPADTR